MIRISWFAMFGLAAALLLLLGLFGSARRSSPARSALGRVLLIGLIVAGIAVIVLGLTLPITWYVSESSRSTEARPTRFADADPRQAYSPQTPRSRSHEIAQEVFPVEPQPSEQLALETAAQAMARELSSLYDQGSNVKVFVEGDVQSNAWKTVAEAFRRLRDPALLTDLADGSTDVITLEYLIRRTQSGNHGVKLSAVLPDGQGTLRESVLYVDKPWAADLQAYRREQDFQGRLLRVVSDFHPSQEEALADLEQRVAEALEEDLHKAMRIHLSPEALELAETSREQGRLGRDIADSVRNSALWADEFAQQSRRSYATLHRAQALVQISAKTLEQLSGKLEALYAARIRRQVRRKLNMVHIVLALLAVALGATMLYLLANTWTRGYYAWPLRAGALIAAVAGGGVVLHLMGPGL